MLRYDPEVEEEEEGDEALEEKPTPEEAEKPARDAAAEEPARDAAGEAAPETVEHDASPVDAPPRKVEFLSSCKLRDLDEGATLGREAVLVWRKAGSEVVVSVASDSEEEDDGEGGDAAEDDAALAARIASLPPAARQRIAGGLAVAREAFAAVTRRLVERAAATGGADIGPDDVHAALAAVRAEMEERGIQVPM